MWSQVDRAVRRHEIQLPERRQIDVLQHPVRLHELRPLRLARDARFGLRQVFVDAQELLPVVDVHLGEDDLAGEVPGAADGIVRTELLGRELRRHQRLVRMEDQVQVLLEFGHRRLLRERPARAGAQRSCEVYTESGGVSSEIDA
jgi:hypothetical protein